VRFYGLDYHEHVFSRSPPPEPERFWFLGSVSPAAVAEVLKASDLHVYPSRSYVVSRSLVEAMATGCVILAADTVPGREFITPGQTGILVPFNDIDSWESQAREVLDHPHTYQELGLAAATKVRELFAQDVTMPDLAKAFDIIVNGAKG